MLSQEIPDRTNAPITINGVKGVSVAMVRKTCEGCYFASLTDINHMGRMVNMAKKGSNGNIEQPISILNQHWCSHAVQRDYQAENARKGICPDRRPR